MAASLVAGLVEHQGTLKAPLLLHGISCGGTSGVVG